MNWTTLIRICVSHDEQDTTDIKKLKKFADQIESSTDTNTTPLHFAALGNNISLATWLLENGATIRTYEDGQTPLHWASKQGNCKMVQLLLDNMTKEQVLMKDIDNTTAYDWSIEYSNSEISTLLQVAAPVNTNKGETTSDYFWNWFPALKKKL